MSENIWATSAQVSPELQDALSRKVVQGIGKEERITEESSATADNEQETIDAGILDAGTTNMEESEMRRGNEESYELEMQDKDIVSTNEITFLPETSPASDSRHSQSRQGIICPSDARN